MVGSPIRRARMASRIARATGETEKLKPTPKGSKSVVSSLPPPTPKPARVEPSADVGDVIGQLTASDLANPEINRLFESLRVQSLLFAQQVMEMQLDPDDRNFPKILAVKQQIAASVLTATVRTRPGDLREREDDGIGALLAEVRSADTAPRVTRDDLLN